MRNDIEELELRMREQGPSLGLLSRLADLYREKGFAQRALSLYLEASSRAWAAEHMDEAVALLVRCLEIDPESRNVRALLRSIFRRSGKLDETRTALQELAAEYEQAGNTEALAATQGLLKDISDPKKLGERLASGLAARQPPRAPADPEDLPPACSFCGRDQSEVKKLIAGPNAYICNECVQLCQEVIDESIGPDDADAVRPPGVRRPTRPKKPGE